MITSSMRVFKPLYSCIQDSNSICILLVKAKGNISCLQTHKFMCTNKGWMEDSPILV